MSSKIKITLKIILFLISVFFTIILFIGWDNFKLNLSRGWGFFTIHNNPLLKSYDKDLKDINKVDNPEPRINLNNLLSGGPPKDGIPSIDNPQFTNIEETIFSDDEIIIGVFLNNESRAYPYGVLNWHEIINDKIGDTPITITLCPLCDTNPVFIRKVNGQETTFGVSGKLYQSCLVMYDRLTDTLWSQPWGLGVAGENTNQNLQKIPAYKTTLGAWKQKYPNTKVLSHETGFRRDYFSYPYGTYYTDSNLIFPVRNQDKLKVHPKEIESYIWIADNKTPTDKFSGESFRISQQDMEEAQQKTIDFNAKEVNIIWDDELNTVKFFSDKTEIPATTAFGFVYPAFFE